MATSSSSNSYPADGPAGLPPRNPKNRASDRRPWTGTITLTTSSSLGPTTTQRIQCVASDTHGHCRGDLWNRDFTLTISHKRGVLADFLSWANSNSPYLSTMMPLTLPDPDKNKANDSAFRSLSRVLSANQTVALAKWDRPDVPGAGVILYPLKTSNCLLGAAIFLVTAFPECITSRVTSLVMPLRSQTPTPQILRQHHHPPSHQSYPSPNLHRSQTPMPGSSRHHSHSHSHSVSAKDMPFHYNYQGSQQSSSGNSQYPSQGYGTQGGAPSSPLSPYSSGYPHSPAHSGSASGPWAPAQASGLPGYPQYPSPTGSYPSPSGYPTR